SLIHRIQHNQLVALIIVSFLDFKDPCKLEINIPNYRDKFNKSIKFLFKLYPLHPICQDIIELLQLLLEALDELDQLYENTHHANHHSIIFLSPAETMSLHNLK